MHESLDEFEFRQVPTTDYGVSCPWASEKSMYNVVNTLAPSFLIEFSSLMQVRRTTIISRTSLKYCMILPHTAKLANSSSCTTTSLSKVLTSCLTAIKNHWIKYCEKTYEREGIYKLFLVYKKLY